MKKTGVNIYVYDFSVNYDAIAVANIKRIYHNERSCTYS